jgi:hypothetical protein
MNARTFIILFLLGVSCSCTMTYEKKFGEEQHEEEHRVYETGTFYR